MNAAAFNESWVLLETLGFNRSRVLWEADHILPVDEGGTDDLGNFQTLCLHCHKEKTARQAKRRRTMGRKWRWTKKMLRLAGR